MWAFENRVPFRIFITKNLLMNVTAIKIFRLEILFIFKISNTINNAIQKFYVGIANPSCSRKCFVPFSLRDRRCGSEYVNFVLEKQC